MSSIETEDEERKKKKKETRKQDHKRQQHLHISKQPRNEYYIELDWRNQRHLTAERSMKKDRRRKEEHSWKNNIHSSTKKKHEIDEIKWEIWETISWSTSSNMTRSRNFQDMTIKWRRLTNRVRTRWYWIR